MRNDTNYQYLAKEPSNVWIPFYESDDEGAERSEQRCTAARTGQEYPNLTKQLSLR